MIRVDAKYLGQEAHLLGLRTPPGKTDGVNSQSRVCHLSARPDGRLHVEFTDGRMAFMSAIPASGGPDEWGIALRSERVVPLFSELGDLASGLAGGSTGPRSVAIGPEGENAIRVTCGEFTATYPGEAMVNPFPRLSIPEDPRAWVPAPVIPLADALSFLSDSSRKEDAADESRTMGLFQAGVGMANQQGAYLVCPVPTLGLDLVLRTRVARRVARWLGRMKNPPATAPVEVARFAWSGEDYLCLRTAGGIHAVCIPIARRPFPHEVLDDRRTRPLVVQGVIRRAELTAFTALVRAAYPGASLVCAARRSPPGDWNATVTSRVGSNGASFSHRFTLRPVSALAPEQGLPEPVTDATEVRFRVGAKQFLEGLRRVGGSEVLLAYRPAGNLLGVRRWSRQDLSEEGDHWWAFLPAPSAAAEPANERGREPSDDQTGETAVADGPHDRVPEAGPAIHSTDIDERS